MDSFKEFRILNEGYGTSKPFNRYKTFEMFATAPENIAKATKVLQDASFTMNSTFNSNLDAKTNVKKGETTKTPIEAFQYAIDKSTINNGGMLLQAMAIAHYILGNTKAKIDDVEDHGKANQDFMDKVKMHLATNRPVDSNGEEKDQESEMKKITAKINSLRLVYQSITSKGKNINQSFKNAHEIIAGTKNYYDSSDYIALSQLFVKKNVPPVPPKKDAGATPANAASGSTDDTSKDAEANNQEGESTKKQENTENTTQAKKEIPLDIESYKKEINDIIDAKKEELKNKFNIQEEILSSVDKSLTEMFRKTHDENGEETEYYQKKKVLSSEKFIDKKLEDIREKALKKLESLFGTYNDKIITKNKKADLKIKIQQIIPQLKIEANNASHKMFRDLTQNEVGIGVDAAGKDIKNAASTIKNAVKNSTIAQKTADMAKTVAGKAKDIGTAASEKIKDTKETLDKNVADAKDVNAKGGDAGLVGKAMDARKAVNDKLKNVFFGRKQATQAKAQAQQPVAQPQAALPAPQAATQPQPVAQAQPVTQDPNKPIILPDNSPKALPSPEDVRKREEEEAKKKFKPQLATDNNQQAKQASIDTDKKKLKKIRFAMKDRIK